MLTVPQEFHDYSRAPERRTDLIVRLDPLSWPTDINAHGTAHSLCMPIQWDKSPPHRLYATGEYNRTPLDGRALVNGWAGQVYGYLSNALSDQDGLFMKDTVKLSCTRNGGAISVLTICFDPAANEYAVDFDVNIDGASSTETYHQEWHIRNNDQPIVYITGIRAAYDTVTVMVSKWSHPFHRARIREIANGVLFEATGDSLYSCNLISESDPTNQSIPTGECTLTYPDPLGMFDPANPAGVASAVRSDQIMTVWIGVSDGQHKPVYAKVGAYYCPKATSKGGTGELHAVDILGKLQDAAKPNARSLDHLHNQSLADFVLGLGASPWIPATDFTGSAPTAFDKGTNRLECLRYVSQYLHKLLYVDADGNARLTAMSRTPVAVIPLDQSYEHPSIEAREELGGIDYTWHRYEDTGEEILAATAAIQTAKGVPVTYTAITEEPVAYTRCEVEHPYASDFVVTLVSATSYAIRITVRTDAVFTDPDEYNVTVRLYGKKIEDQTGSGTSEKDSVVNKEQNRMSVDNPIPVGILDRLTWGMYLRRTYGKADITCNWRGDASLQVGDPVTVEGKYGPLNGVIIKQEIDYDGALTMRTTVRQPDWMINLGGEG